MGLKFTPVVVRCLLGSLSVLGLWLALLGLIASPNTPNRSFNFPPRAIKGMAVCKPADEIGVDFEIFKILYKLNNSDFYFA